MKFTDAEIIQGVIKQNENVLRFIYKDYYEPVRKLVFIRGGDGEDAWDIFQESLAILVDQILRDGESMVFSSTLKTFFLEICKHQWYKNLRSKDRTVIFDSDFIKPDILKEDLTQIEADEIEAEQDTALFRIYMKHLLRLKPGCRKILKMLANDKSPMEISEKLGLKSSQAVYNKKRACIRLMIELINEDKEYKKLIKNEKPRTD